MASSHWGRERSRRSLQPDVQTRAVETPDEILLNRIGLTLVSAIGEERDRLMDGLLEALEGQRRFRHHIDREVLPVFLCKERQAKIT